MRKIYLLALCASTYLSASAQSTVFFDDFEEGNLEGYELVNFDGLVPFDADLASMADSAWTVKFISAQGWTYGNSAFSVSWYENDEGPSDDWLISPAIEIGSNAILEWDAMAITSSGDFRDRYQVWIGPSQQIDDYNLLAPVFDTGDTGEVAEPIHRMLDLAALGYENQTIHVAFRNTTQPFDPDGPDGPGNGGNELVIDNIEISTVLSVSDGNARVGDLVLMPNPSAGDMSLQFDLKEASETKLQIVDITGKVLRNEVLGILAPGSHMVAIDRGNLSDGVYFIRLQTEDLHVVLRAVLN